MDPKVISVALVLLSLPAWVYGCRSPAAPSDFIDTSSLVTREFEAPSSEPWTHFVSEFARDRRVVALGECSHYSAECYDLKAAAIRRLARDGFDGLALEVDFGQAILWDQYVVSGEGDLDELVRRSAWFTYRTQEFKDFLGTLREHNRTSPKPFRILGMEMTTLQPGLEWLASTVETAAGDAPWAAPWVEDLRRERAHVAFLEHSPEERADLWSLFAQSEALLAAHGDALAERTSVEALGRATRMVELIRQYATYVSQDDGSLKVEIRDQFSARNVLWWLDQLGEGSRIALWAHNGHVARRSPFQGYDVLGHYLGHRFGEAYGAIGFTFNSGKMGAYGDDGFEHIQFERAPEPSLTASLARRHTSFLVLDVSATLQQDTGRTSPLREPLAIRRDMAESFTEGVPDLWQLRLEGVYDALVYIDESHMPTTLEWIR